MTFTLRYLGRQTLRLLCLLVLVSLATYALVYFAPVDPITAYISAGDVVSPNQRAEIAAYFGENQGFWSGYTSWLRNLLHLDLGTSLIYRTSVASVILEKSSASLALMLCAFVVSGALGLGLGLVMGEHPKADRVLRPLCLTLTATPTFFLGILLLIVFSVKLGWFPIAFSVPMATLHADTQWYQSLPHLVLPVATLSLASCPSVALHTREKVLALWQSDYVRLAKSRGFTPGQIRRRHILRNVCLPFVTLQCASLSEIFGGSLLAETVFSYPGLGAVMVDAGLKGDVPLLLGVTMFSCVFVFVGNFTANVLYGCIDPKIRYGGTL